MTQAMGKDSVVQLDVGSSWFLQLFMQISGSIRHNHYVDYFFIFKTVVRREP